MSPASCDVEPAAVERGEHVQRDRQDLEREEHDDQVVGRRHQHHARRRAQHQRVVLRRLEVLALRGSPADRNSGEQRREQHDGLHEHREPVDRDHACDRLVRPVVVDDVPLDEHEHARRRARRANAVSSAASSTTIVVPDQRAAEHDHERGPNSASGGAIANQSIDGVVIGLRRPARARTAITRRSSSTATAAAVVARRAGSS